MLCVLTHFYPRDALRVANSSRAANDRADRDGPAGLTMRQRGGAFWINLERLHPFKTTARIGPRR